MSISREELESVPKLSDAASFPLWELELNILFTAKRLMQVVDGTFTLQSCESDENKKEEWATKDAQAKYILMRTIELSAKSHVLTCKTSKDMLDSLCKIYKRDTDQTKNQLLAEFFSFTYDKSVDVMSNIARIQTLTFRLNNLNMSVDEQMLMTKILVCLPDQFKHFTSAWDSTHSQERTLENLKARLLKEEEKYKNTKDETKVAFKTGPKNKQNKITCYNCGLPGHRLNECKKTINKGNQQQSSSKQCQKCNKSGHISEECWFGKTFSTCKYCKKNNHPENKCRWKNEHENKDNGRKNINNRVTFLAETYDTSSEENIIKYLDTKFVCDSGSTDHLSHVKDILINTKKTEEIKIGCAKKGENLTSTLVGDVESNTVVLKDVNYVPNLSRNLLSVNAVTNAGAITLFDKEKVKIVLGQVTYKDEDVVLEGNKTQSGLYIVDMANQSEALITQRQTAIEWHNKLGHLNFRDLKKIPLLCDGADESLVKCNPDEFCEACTIGKLVRNPFNTQRQRATRPLEIIHSDVCGKISPETYDSEKYFLTVMDDFTHFLKVYLLHTKDETEEYLMEYINEAEAHFNLKTEKIRCDNGGEFRSKEFKSWCRQRGIVLDYTIPESPQLNGVAERVNLTLMNKVRSMLTRSMVNTKLWGFAILTAAYQLNRSPTKAIDVTPYEKWNGTKPNLKYLQEFGSIVYTKRLGYLKKLDDRGQKAIFVGYAPNGYRVWNPKTKKVYLSRDIEPTNMFEEPEEKKGINIIAESLMKFETFENHEGSREIDQEEQEQPAERQEDGNSEITEEEYQEAEDEDSERDHEEENIENNQLETPNERARRQRRRPRRFDDYVLDYENEEEALITFQECLESDDRNKWNKAIHEEKESLMHNKTWELVDEKYAKGKQIISSRWVFKIKDDGRYKARLVARGCQQKKNSLDFKETYSSVVQASSLRTMLAIGAMKDLQFLTFDVKSAFLHGDLQEEIFLKLPEGFNHPGKVCLLHKALYGLRQSPFLWFKKLTDFLKQEGLIQLKSDKCVFKNPKGKRIFYLAIHVDDGLILGEDLSEIKCLLKKMQKNFEVTINENPHFYLGLQIKKRHGEYMISQSKYCKQIVEKYSMENSRAKDTPIVKEEKDQEQPSNEDFPYKEAVGSLLYASCKTRPDLSYAVGYESRFMQNPTTENIKNVKRTMRYLKGTTDFGINYFSKNNDDLLQMHVYCDADHAGDKTDSKSTSGFVMIYGNGPIAWSSKKQKTVAQSSTEAEYVAAAQCCAQMKYMKTLIEELLDKKIKTILHVDNESAIKMIKSGQISFNSHHIEIKHHFIHDELNQGWFTIKYCPSEDQVADIFTKPLQRVKFQQFRDFMMKEIDIKI